MRKLADELSSPVPPRQTQKKAYETVPLKREQGSLSNDATQPASKDTAAHTTIPFSVESPCAQVLDYKLSVDLLGPPAIPRESNVSSHLAEHSLLLSDDASFREMLSVFLPCGDDVTPDASTCKRASKQPRRSPRFTDNNTSKTLDVDDDFQHIDKKLKRSKRSNFSSRTKYMS